MSEIDEGWQPIKSAPTKEIVYVGTPKLMVLAFKDEVGQWRKKVDGAPLNWRVKQWKPRTV